ncbi:MAG: Mitochondrial chaperone Frataxin [Cirrosporium novae-zelandiae]|nr:MAG: Mitochondrial chaperone Frataxin [Cirrosporium novae-zelandiae]
MQSQRALVPALQAIRSSPRCTSSRLLNLSARFNPTVNVTTRCLYSHNVSFFKSTRSLYTSSSSSKGISPDDPDKHNHVGFHVAEPADIDMAYYHEQADDFLERLISCLEEIQEEDEEVDVEYSAGVATIVFPPNGTYVLNKQPHNKQIWLSSPISGPKRYDWVMTGDSMQQKEDSEESVGDWIYLRDGSTLKDLLRRELGVDVEDI